jgi:hypothetical protein
VAAAAVREAAVVVREAEEALHAVAPVRGSAARSAVVPAAAIRAVHLAAGRAAVIREASLPAAVQVSAAHATDSSRSRSVREPRSRPRAAERATASSRGRSANLATATAPPMRWGAVDLALAIRASGWSTAPDR